jgi:hypothetical protein
VEPSCTTNALSDIVVPTVDDEKSTLLGAQNTRATTIKMTEKPTAEDDGVLWRDRSRALRARSRLLFHLSVHLPENGGRREDSTEPLFAQYAAPPAASRATVSAPSPCLSRSWASAPSPSCRTWRASLGHRTESCLSLIDVVASVGFAGSEEQFQLIASAVDRNPKHAEPVVRLLDRDHL